MGLNNMETQMFRLQLASHYINLLFFTTSVLLLLAQESAEGELALHYLLKMLSYTVYQHIMIMHVLIRYYHCDNAG